MNLSQLKGFVAANPQPTEHADKINKQLQQAGLQQARQGVRGVDASSNASISSNAFVGAKVLNSSLKHSVVVDEQKANLPAPKSEQQGSFFDFEEVAKNVLNFVGGVIKRAHANGAESNELEKLFQQAESGVAKGIKMAEKDLKGFMNDEIEAGISNSREKISEGLAALRSELLGEQQATQRVSESLNLSRAEGASIQIRTKDGDDVTLSVSQLRQASYHAEATRLDDSNPGEHSPESEFSADSAGATRLQQSTFIMQQQNVQLTVRGDLDEQEREAIFDLVKDISGVADDFFNGDIELAYQQAIDLGFDDKELAGFALNLSRSSQVEVIRTYESVEHFSEEADRARLDGAVVAKPIANYLDKVMAMMEKAQQQLEDKESYDNLVNGLLNNVLDVDTPDLISAINRFNQFNARLITNLPASEGADR